MVPVLLQLPSSSCGCCTVLRTPRLLGLLLVVFPSGSNEDTDGDSREVELLPHTVDELFADSLRQILCAGERGKCWRTRFDLRFTQHICCCTYDHLVPSQHQAIALLLNELGKS